MRPVRLAAILALVLAVAACSSGAGAGWTYTPTEAPSAAASGSGAGASGSNAAASGSTAAGSAEASGSASSSGSAAAGSGTQIALSAQAIKFDKSTLDAPASAPFTINFTNNDSGVPHDVVIKSSSGATVFAGDPFAGPASKAYSVPALPAGSYTFICSIHPTLMTGTLNVK